MVMSSGFRVFLRVFTAVALLFVYAPLLLVVVNSFNKSQTFAWPPTGLTLDWWHRAANSQGARDALLTSVEVACLATVLALVLGTMAAMALQRYRFFGRDAVSLLIILPIALPGIVTGIAFNNVVARLRRVGVGLEEASSDLGASMFQTFWLVTFPMMRSALIAGALLAFALSFDEIIVTTFTAGPKEQTLPLWIFNNLFRPNQGPVVNVIAVVLILVSIVPIWISQKLAGTSEGLAGR
jgi:putative spermidine/putrescine transport system permease protein